MSSVMCLIVSLHFVPMARLFHVRVYYVTALIGSIISLPALALAGLSETFRLGWFGGGMAAIMWLAAWYILWKADRITARAMRETWAV